MELQQESHLCFRQPHLPSCWAQFPQGCRGFLRVPLMPQPMVKNKSRIKSWEVFSPHGGRRSVPAWIVWLAGGQWGGLAVGYEQGLWCSLQEDG